MISWQLGLGIAGAVLLLLIIIVLSVLIGRKSASQKKAPLPVQRPLPYSNIPQAQKTAPPKPSPRPVQQTAQQLRDTIPVQTSGPRGPNGVDRTGYQRLPGRQVNGNPNGFSRETADPFEKPSSAATSRQIYSNIPQAPPPVQRPAQRTATIIEETPGYGVLPDAAYDRLPIFRKLP